MNSHEFKAVIDKWDQRAEEAVEHALKDCGGNLQEAVAEVAELMQNKSVAISESMRDLSAMKKDPVKGMEHFASTLQLSVLVMAHLLLDRLEIEELKHAS